MPGLPDASTTWVTQATWGPGPRSARPFCLQIAVWPGMWERLPGVPRRDRLDRALLLTGCWIVALGAAWR